MGESRQQVIGELYDKRESLSPSDVEAAALVFRVLEDLDAGRERVAYLDVESDDVVVNEWLKQAILLSFRLRGLSRTEAGPFEWDDRLPLKKGFRAAGVRAVPGSSVRFGSYLAPGVTLMPSYVNIGAYVDSGTMVDTWATVGSCAQIGKGVHLSGGVGIGGVLEPPQASPVVVQDDAFIGSRSLVVEGARVGRGAVIGAGAVLTASTVVIDVETGKELERGRIPDYSVVVPGTRVKEFRGGQFGVSCLLVIKRLDPAKRHPKAELNEILRDHGGAL